MDISFEELYNGKLKLIPPKSGVYLVIMPSNFKLQINETTEGREIFKGKNMLYSMEDLNRKAEHYNLPERGGNILYIGKAKNLHNRIKQYVAWGYFNKNNTKSSPHAGGRAIWQLNNNKKLLLRCFENT